METDSGLRESESFLEDKKAFAYLIKKVFRAAEIESSVRNFVEAEIGLQRIFSAAAATFRGLCHKTLLFMFAAC